MDTTIINCDCLCHSIHVKLDKDYNCVNLGLWLYGFHNGKLSWRNRLKILFEGFADSDLIVLNKQELQKLISTLQDAENQLEDLTPREKRIRWFEKETGLRMSRENEQ